MTYQTGDDTVRELETELHNVDPATKLDLIEDDTDLVIVGFDFAEFQSNTMSLWRIPADGDGAYEVAIVWTADDAPRDLSVAVQLLDTGNTILCRRVSVMRPFGAKRMSLDTIDARAIEAGPVK